MKKLSLIFVFLLFLLFLIGNSQALDEKVLPEEKIDVRELGEVLKIEEELELSPIVPENVDEEVFEELEEKEFVRIVVKLKDGDFDFSSIDKLIKDVSESKENILSEIEENGISLIYDYETLNAFAAEVNWEGLEYLMNNEEVEFIYAERILELTLDESVSLINADDVWEINGFENNITGVGEVICVIDSGIDYTHPDLGGCLGEECKVLDGIDFYNNDFDPMDDNFHGTHVAGIVAANGGKKGVAPDAKLLAAKVCGSSGSCSNIEMIAGTDWCINNLLYHDVSVLTMSIGNGGEYNETNCPTWMDFAIDTAYSLDLPFTIASGNDGHKNGISYPACSQNAISVGATYDLNVGPQSWSSCTDLETEADQVTCFSNSHEILDLMAPGAMITSLVLDGGYGTAAGTSMATPHVAGTIALINQFYLGNPFSVDSMMGLLKLTGTGVLDEGNDLIFSRVDAYAAVSEAQECIFPTNGLIISKDTYFCPGEYSVSSGIQISGDNILLDCQGAKLIGNGGEDGIYVSGNYVTIERCSLENYQTGIDLDGYRGKVRYSNFLDNYYGIFSLDYGDDKYHNIYYNSFVDNHYGVLLAGVNLVDIHDNSFSENDIGVRIERGPTGYSYSKENDVYDNIFEEDGTSVSTSSEVSDNKIWGNDFYVGDVTYESTNNDYCISGEGNNYFDGAVGPTCECMPLLDGIIINSNNPLCLSGQEFHFPNGITLGKSYLTLDCKGSKLIGTGSEKGIYMLDIHHVTVQNCNIIDYFIGVHVESYYDEYDVDYISMSNNNISLNYYGIYLEGDSSTHKIYHADLFGNNIFSNNYGIYGSFFGNSIIKDNYLFDNGAGVSLEYGVVTTSIYNNYFNNSNNARTDEKSYSISWNLGLNCNQENIIGGNCTGGNYWSNYYGVDVEGDGVGDTEIPYNNSGEIENGGDYLPLTFETLYCIEDINNDNVVNTNDLLIVVSDWGSSNSPADVNLDGTVDTNDLLNVVAAWGEC